MPGLDTDADGGSDIDADVDVDTDVDTDVDSDSDSGNGHCVPGGACYDGPEGTLGVGTCVGGAIECRTDAPVCEGWVGPKDEECNGLDDDCDGEVDGVAADDGSFCLTGLLGACHMGALLCVGGADTCVAPEPVDETCANPGRDDDCDGADDDVPTLGDACDSGLAGICAAGAQACEGDVLVCAALVEAGARDELCETGEDEDCDGDVDEVDCTNGGCADGGREGYLDVDAYPTIAGCSGGWDQPGVYDFVGPACDRAAGDDGANSDGVGCDVEDLCAESWHVCRDSADVAASSPDGCDGAADADDAFFVTRQGGPGWAECATGDRAGCTGTSGGADCAPNADTTNDLFGCGTIGEAPRDSCAPLDRFSNDACYALGDPWSCPGGITQDDEALTVVKSGPARGGVLCCHD